MYTIPHLRQKIAEQYPSATQATVNTTMLDIDNWWLLGTQGCHLCDKAEDLLRLFSKVEPVSWQSVDIAYLEEPLLVHFSKHIPVLLTPTIQLNYPFSTLDLQVIL